MLDIIKNPAIIGFVVGLLTYIYLVYNERKKSKNDDGKKENVNLMIPFVVAFIAWFIAYAYTSYNYEKTETLENLNNYMTQTNRTFQKVPLPTMSPPKYKFTHDIIDDLSSPQAMTLLNKPGLNLSQPLPDFMLEMKK